MSQDFHIPFSLAVYVCPSLSSSVSLSISLSVCSPRDLSLSGVCLSSLGADDSPFSHNYHHITPNLPFPPLSYTHTACPLIPLRSRLSPLFPFLCVSPGWSVSVMQNISPNQAGQTPSGATFAHFGGHTGGADCCGTSPVCLGSE